MLLGLHTYSFYLQGDIDMKRAYEIFKTKSTMQRINIETEMDIPLDNMQQALQMEKNPYH